MPSYDYYCKANGKTIEVNHSMNKRLKTWGQVCRWAKVDPGQTSPKVSVVRLISSVTPTVFRLKGLDKDAPGKKLEL